MRPFALRPAGSAAAAVRALADPALAERPGASDRRGDGAAVVLAGGTSLVDLMKLDVARPAALVEMGAADDALAFVTAAATGLHLGARARMSDVADHPAVRRDYPAVAESLQQAASAQLRNMATLAGNLLQRTRCSYFRDTSWARCNKRAPGSGCDALDGVHREHAILGVSDRCIASYPGDFAQAFVALDGHLDVLGPQGARTVRAADLHLASGDSPDVETTLAPGEVITALHVPAGPWTRCSAYVKVRDRDSYAFAVASAAVALDVAHGVVREARVGLGGVAGKPWRSAEAEAVLRGHPLDEARAEAAARAAFAGAELRPGNAYKRPLGERTLVRALLHAASLDG